MKRGIHLLLLRKNSPRVASDAGGRRVEQFFEGGGRSQRHSSASEASEASEGLQRREEPLPLRPPTILGPPTPT